MPLRSSTNATQYKVIDMSVKHLKDYTDEQCMGLAGQYYKRAVKAEKELSVMHEAHKKLRAEYQKIIDFAHEVFVGLET